MKRKLKNSKSAQKRFKLSSSGAKLRRHVKLSHFNAKQTGSARRNKRAVFPLAKSNEKDVRNLMPYISS